MITTSRRRRTALMCCGLAVAATVATGCGASSGPPASEAKGGGILSVGVTASLGRLKSLNPLADNLYGSWIARQLIYPALVQLDGTQLKPAWASKWDVSGDGRVYTFHLQPGSWSDGKPMTAHDAAWTATFELEHAGDAAGLVSFALEGVKSVKAADDRTLVVTYEEPVAESVLTLLANFHVLPKHVYEPHAAGDGSKMTAFRPEDKLPVVAGGPFTVTEFQSDGTTIFEPNKGYYGAAPRVQAVGLRVFQNDEGLAQALRAGDVGWGYGGGSAVAASVKGAAGVEVVSSPSQEVALLNINSNPKKRDAPELREVKVREAMSLAIDRKELIEVALNGYGEPGRSVLAPFLATWIPQDLQPDPHDTAKANAILDELGYKRGADGVRVTPGGDRMAYSMIVWEEITRVAEILQKNLAEVGIEVKPDIAPDYTAAVTAPDGKYLDFDMAFSYWTESPDPGGVLRVYSCDSWGSVNFAGYCDKTFDSLLADQRGMLDQAKRQEAVATLQRMLLRDSRAALPLYHAETVHVVAKGWTGIDTDRFGPDLWTQIHRGQ
ncbi:ABC transporter substrate-binding protein [Nonomuraea turcica]|uniref:ABC transporter substrate-binding protein n=1 Tax=Nonomuraea sp. G32 TaxID=3067274 RepID=UPI00273A95CA|nr:ABC transporter substrate-binding protein [Nonomuraea sp. G32]MDP4501317.1 ABC transporter substrate-binding protein [Nonomuraea sp. G32]